VSSQPALGSQSARISVIIPAYRSAGTIRRAIDSALAQTYAPAEIIVVDDGSPDDQATVITGTYGSRVRLLRKDNGGAASARNAGIDQATGEYIAFLDADDHWESHKLASQLEVFDRHPEVGLVAGSFFEARPEGPRRERLVQAAPRSWYGRVLRFTGTRAFRLATVIWTSTVISRRAPLERERFDTGLASCHDRDLWFRLVLQSPAYLVVAPLATAVLLEGSISRSSVDRDKRNMLRVVERYGESLGRIGTRVWRSHTLYRWAAEDMEPRSALPRLLRSFMLWPLPYAGFASCPPLGRLRRLAVLLAAASQLTKRGSRTATRA
jgi:glycosyltransferase involved in cell wall biosynthesis